MGTFLVLARTGRWKKEKDKMYIFPDLHQISILIYFSVFFFGRFKKTARYFVKRGGGQGIESDHKNFFFDSFKNILRDVL